jgi:hypothetical protein
MSVHNYSYVGIDPGKSGVIAISYRRKIIILPMPLGKDDNLDVVAFLSWLKTCKFPIIACIEQVWKPVTLVRMAGMLEGLLLCANVQVFRVAPSTWRKEILDNFSASKQDAIDYCLRTFPDVSLYRTKKSKTYDHNIADALCIMEYAHRKQRV